MTDFKKVLTPAARTILEFAQFVAYIGGAAFMIYHFVTTDHGEARAAQLPPQVPSIHVVRELDRKVDHALDAINDLRADMTAVMDKLEIADSKRATGRHALPVVTSSPIPIP